MYLTYSINVKHQNTKVLNVQTWTKGIASTWRLWFGLLILLEYDLEYEWFFSLMVLYAGGVNLRLLWFTIYMVLPLMAFKLNRVNGDYGFIKLIMV